MEKIELPKKDRDQWLKALRNGDYHQAEGFLYDTTSKGYCCLGVYGSLKGIPDNLLAGHTLLSDFYTEMEKHNLATCLVGIDSFYYVETGDGRIRGANAWKAGKKEDVLKTVNKNNFQNFLAHMNDSGFSFKEIADVIEETTIGV